MTRRKTKQKSEPERYLDRTLDELEGSWGAAPSASTNLVQACHRLHAKPLRELTDEELRLALLQQIGFPWTLSVVLWRLRQDPLREGDTYPADVLCAALRVPEKEWTPEQRLELKTLASAAVSATAGNADYDLLRRAWGPFELTT